MVSLATIVRNVHSKKSVLGLHIFVSGELRLEPKHFILDYFACIWIALQAVGDDQTWQAIRRQVVVSGLSLKTDLADVPR